MGGIIRDSGSNPDSSTKQSAKNLRLKPIARAQANAFIKANHYSGKIVQNSQLHFGAFWNGRLGGVLQFGPSINRIAAASLVAGTLPQEYLELNRMAFSDLLPRNSESRAIAIAMRLIKKNYPWIKWVISFADATRCGDGTIYRASGFKLIEIKENSRLRENPETGEVMHAMQAYHLGIEKVWRKWKPVAGHQLKYIFFIDRESEKGLNVQTIPFSAIAEHGADMYKGKSRAQHGQTCAPTQARRFDSDLCAPNKGE